MNKKQAKDVFNQTIEEVFENGLVNAVEEARRKRKNGYSISEEDDFVRYRTTLLKELKKELKQKFKLILNNCIK